MNTSTIVYTRCQAISIDWDCGPHAFVFNYRSNYLSIIYTCNKNRVCCVWPQWGCTSGQAKQNIYPLFTLITPWSHIALDRSPSSFVLYTPCTAVHSHLLSPTWRPRPLSIINCRHQLQLRVFSGVGFSFCWLFSVAGAGRRTQDESGQQWSMPSICLSACSMLLGGQAIVLQTRVANWTQLFRTGVKCNYKCNSSSSWRQ